jgi:hypothetical protein
MNPFVFAPRLTHAVLALLMTFLVLGTVRASDPEDAGKSIAAQTFHELLSAGKFAELETFTDKMRTEKRRTRSGLWELEVAYGRSRVSEKKSDDARFEAELALMDKWRAAVPNSITRPIVEAELLIDYAWNARGSGWSSTVSEEGWRLFEERIQRALKTLMEAAAQPSRCVHWYASMQTIALAQGWNRAAYEKLFAAAVETEPAYHQFYFRKAHYLLPRWYGGTGDCAAFAEEATKLYPGGVEIYARIAWAQKKYFENDFYAETGYRWDLVKAGFESMLASWPSATSNPQAYGLFAWRAKDRALAQRLLPIIEMAEVDAAIWGSEANFKKFRRWAKL